MNANIENFLRRPLKHKSATNRMGRNRRPRLSLQCLEDRVTPATFTVENVLDDGSAGSLRWAITQANDSAGADDVVFDSVFFGVPRTISLGSALPVIVNGNVTFTNSTGASHATVTRGASASTNFGIFSIAASSPNVTFDGITISGGNAGLGSAISNSISSNITLRNSVVTGNNGGSSTIAMPSGATGLLTVQNTTISGNTAATGGIYFVGDGSLLVQNSTIHGNTGTSTAAYHGGGIAFFGSVGSGGFTIESSTIHGNTTSSNTGGGAISFRNASGSATLRNSTVTQNTGPTNASGGGGIGVSGGSLFLSMESTVIAENVGPADGPDLRINAGLAEASKSLIGVLPPANFSSTNTLAGTAGLPLDPKLLPLQDNGGSTFTREPKSDSPLLNAGSNPVDLFFDQRGAGYRRIFAGGVDIGAVERQPVGTPYALASVSNVDGSHVGETTYTFEVTFHDPVGANAGINVSTLIGNNAAMRVTGPSGFDQFASYVSIDTPTDGSPRTATYAITPPGGTWNNLDTGNYVVSMEANQVFDLDGIAVPGEQVGEFIVVIPPFVVNNVNDSGEGSLRTALTLANANPGDDFISFDPDFFSIHREIDLLSPLPVISADGGLTITGPGADKLTLDAGNSFQVLVSEAPTLSLSGFTITGGRATYANGGGLLASGIVTLDGMIVTGNSATGTFWVYNGTGGGVAMNPGSFLTVRNSTISGNTAGTNGGGIGITNGGSLVVENSTISGNSALFAGGGYGYFSYVGYYGGGGILFNGPISYAPPAGFTPGAVVIRNSTIANNHTTGSGGGIDMHTYVGTLVLQNSTVSGNSADANGYSYYGYPYGGGGIKRVSYTGAISIINSVVAGNINASIPDIGSRGVVEVNYSAIGSTTGFYLTGANNILNVDPMLGPLQDNGGPTLTMAPLPGSPLIDAGSNDSVPEEVLSDQRGFGFYRTYYSSVDIGAVEDQPIGIPFVAATVPPVVPGTTSHQFTVIFADPNGTNNGIDVSTLIDNDNVIRITGPFGFDVMATFVSIDDPTDGTPRTATYSFAAPGGAWNNYDDGLYSIRTQPDQVADLDGNFIPGRLLVVLTVDIPPLIVINANDSGDGSLRAAILLANSTPTDDYIVFDPAFFNTHQEIHLESPLPTFANTGGAVSITGPGSDLLTIDGVGSFRVFDSLAPSLTLTDLTITGGLATNSSGGGLRASGAVTLERMVFEANSANGNTWEAAGGAIGMDYYSFLTVRGSTIAGNSASHEGGGISFRYGGSFVIENSTISGNSTSFSGPYYGNYGGGGIFFAGPVTDGPAAQGFVPGTVIVRNSTIANNDTTGSGGGLLAYYFDGNLLVQNSTISGNNSDADATHYYTTDGGGGISLKLSYSGALTLENSIVSGNTNRNAPDIQWYERVLASYSAIGDTDGFALNAESGHNLIGATLNLGPLQDNGGPTQTMALGAGSAAIDAGSDELIPVGVLGDQRGFGYYRSHGASVDIGAFEVQPVGGPFAFAETPDIVPGATSYQFTVTFADPLGTNNGIDVSSIIDNDSAVHVIGPDGIDLPATFISIDDATDGTPRTATYSITPPGGFWNNYDNGVFTVRLQPGQVADLDGNLAPNVSIGRFEILILPLLVKNANDSGAGSLREAIAKANVLPGDDVIVFDPGFFNTNRVINLLKPLPEIPQSGGGLTIAGPGVANLTVDAGGAFRVLHSYAPTLNLSGFTITRGLAQNDNGGAILANGIVTLDGMAITNSSATGDPGYYNGFGGGIAFEDAGFLTVRNSTISGNSAETNGGGIGMYYGGSLIVENSTISGNSTTYVGQYAGYYGGGGIMFSGYVSNYPPDGFTPGTVVIRNSTIVDNTTKGSGGGFFSSYLLGTLLVQSSTITGNKSDASGSGYYGYPDFGGGGLALLYGGAKLVVENSVISGNINSKAPDILSDYWVETSFSLIGDGRGYVERLGTGNLAHGTDPKLGPLQNNGGPTKTRAPLSGSPLINKGSTALVPAGLTSDQRGGTFARVFGASVDIGSIEVQNTGVTIDQAIGQADPTNGSTIAFTVHFTASVTGFTASDVSFVGSTVGGTLVAAVTGSGSDYTVTVTGMTGQGTVVASIPAGAATDAFGAPTLASTSSDNSVTFGGVGPTVTIEQAAGQADPTTAGPIAFTVHFNEAVTGFDAADVSFAGSTVGGTLVASVTGSGSDYTVTVSGMTGEGNVVASIPAGAVTDASGNGSSASTSVDNTVYFDDLEPSVTIDQAVGQADPTGAASIKFDVKFSEPVTGFDASDVSFVGSTAGGALVASVSGSGKTYTVTVTGMTSAGTVVASIPAGAASDAVGHLSLASTSTDNSVEFSNTGIVGFSSDSYSADEEAGTLTITVSRTGGSGGPITIQYASSDGTAHSGGSASTGQADYTPVSGMLSWLDGEEGDKTFEIPILSDDLNEGLEQFILTLTVVTGSPDLGITTATVAIAPSDGQGPGKYLDQDGDKYTIKLKGKTGSMLYYRTDPDGDGMGPIELIELTDTLPDPLKPKASLAISVSKSKTSTDGGTVELGAITGSGLKSISARKVDLTGEGIDLDGYLGALKIGNITNGANITTLATTNSKQKTKINALAIGDGTAIEVGAHMRSLTALSFGAGSLTAPSIGTMTIKGDMAADVNITGMGVDPTKKALTKLSVKGAVTGSDIFVNGNVGTVSVGAFRDSRLFAGYSGPDDGSGSFNFPATVTKFKANGKTDGFQDSRVIATNFKSVRIVNLDSTNSSEKFGFYAYHSLGIITVVGPEKFRYDPNNPEVQGIGDFEVILISP